MYQATFSIDTGGTFLLQARKYLLQPQQSQPTTISRKYWNTFIVGLSLLHLSMNQMLNYQGSKQMGCAWQPNNENSYLQQGEGGEQAIWELHVFLNISYWHIYMMCVISYFYSINFFISCPLLAKISQELHCFNTKATSHTCDCRSDMCSECKLHTGFQRLDEKDNVTKYLLNAFYIDCVLQF